MSPEISEVDLRFRYAAFLLLGILAGMMANSLWSAITIYPYLNPNPYNPNGNGNGNGNENYTTTTTTPITTTTPPQTISVFTFLTYEDGRTVHAGYAVENGSTWVRFAVNVREVRGYAGTLHLYAEVYTDPLIWGSVMFFGGDFYKEMGAYQTVTDIPMYFLCEDAIRLNDAIDWTTAKVTIVYD